MSNGTPFADFTQDQLINFVQAVKTCFQGNDEQQALLFALLSVAASQTKQSRDGQPPGWTVKFSYDKKAQRVEVQASPQAADQALWEQRFMDAFLPGSKGAGPVTQMRIIPAPPGPGGPP